MFIQTERLVLKPFAPQDDGALGVLLKNEQIKKTYMIPDFEDETRCMKMVRRFRELSRDDSRFVAGIYLDDGLIGFMNDVEMANGAVELGYVIDPAHHNRGYATEALRGAIGFLLEQGFREVVTGAFESNAASIRVMAKAGMKKLSKTDEIEYRGNVHKCVYYSAAAEDFLEK